MLYEQVFSFSNITLAYLKARKGKRCFYAPMEFERTLEIQLFQLQDELVNKTYQPGAYRSFYKTESKRRLISAAPFRDRVVHHALINIIEPAFERGFIYDSYANRVGKGTHRALDRCTQFMRSSKYVMPFDVKQFFPSIDHAILRNQLADRIPDEDIMGLVDRILDNGRGVLDEMYCMQWFSGDDLLALFRPRGLPLGNLTSQFWANVYLNRLDQYIKREIKCKKYIRYVDDFLLFADDKITLQTWRQDIIQFMELLRLTIHENSAQSRPVAEGLPFLGFVVYPDHRRLKSRCGHAYQRRLNACYRKYLEGGINQEKIKSSLQGWIGHASHGDTWQLRKALLHDISF